MGARETPLNVEIEHKLSLHIYSIIIVHNVLDIYYEMLFITDFMSIENI